MQTNDNTKGILFIMTGMAFFSIQDSLIKFIFEDIALFELYLGRTLIQATILISFFLITKKIVAAICSFIHRNFLPSKSLQNASKMHLVSKQSRTPPKSPPKMF